MKYFSKKIVLFLFGRKKTFSAANLKNVKSILMRPVGDAIGDAVAHCAYAEQLKFMYPHSYIGVLVTSRNRAVFALSPYIDELIENKSINYFKQRKKWDLLLDFYEYFYSWDIIANAILSPKLVMIFKKKEKKYYTVDTVRNYDFYCPPLHNDHISNRITTSIFSDYFSIPKSRFQLKINQDKINSISTFWPEKEGKKVRILLAPQGSYARRHIPPKELATLLNNCDKSSLKDICFLLCRSKHSEYYFEKLKTYCEKDIPIHLSDPTTLDDYLALIASSDIAICIDSGAVHLACAFNKPLLAFYSNLPENFDLWHPLPQDNTPILILRSTFPILSKKTRNSPVQDATPWLNKQIAIQKEKKRHM